MAIWTNSPSTFLTYPEDYIKIYLYVFWQYGYMTHIMLPPSFLNKFLGAYGDAEHSFKYHQLFLV